MSSASAADLLARGLIAEHVRIRTAAVTCERDGDAYVLGVSCVLDTERPEDRRPLAIDFAGSLLEYVSATCDAADAIHELPVDPLGHPIVVLTLGEGRGWQDSRLARARPPRQIPVCRWLS